jgi:hypothetical protein
MHVGDFVSVCTNKTVYGVIVKKLKSKKNYPIVYKVYSIFEKEFIWVVEGEIELYENL